MVKFHKWFVMFLRMLLMLFFTYAIVFLTAVVEKKYLLRFRDLFPTTRTFWHRLSNKPQRPWLTRCEISKTWSFSIRSISNDYTCSEVTDLILQDRNNPTYSCLRSRVNCNNLADILMRSDVFLNYESRVRRIIYNPKLTSSFTSLMYSYARK